MASHEHIQIQNTFSSGGKIHHVHRAAAEHSVVIRTLLRDFDAADLAHKPIPISVDVSDGGLALVIAWLEHWKDVPKASDEIVTGDDSIPVLPLFSPWDRDFFGSLNSGMLREVLVATNYFEIKPMHDLACQTVVNMIRGKNSEEMRAILNVQSDLTPKQERAVRRRPMWVFSLDHLWARKD